ncbi:MAG: aspartate carbamoyltransferase [Acutalibacteraceae bacterium]|nr:aspartate carbamoyltransferase [Acutalibacteraceae bacterium]
MLNHIIDLELLSFSDLQEIVQLAEKIMKNPQDYSEACKGKIMGTLFYEPSTRTQMSFQTAMLRLGGSIIGFDDPMNSSVSKGESLKDTIKIISGYADIIAMRHPLEGSARGASIYSSVPVINAGDGGHLHPTQTLTDLVTLHNEKGRLNHLTIGLCGDLKNGRTVHSLIKTMSYFEGNKFVLISTPELGVPEYVKEIMDKNGCEYTEIPTLQEAMPDLDVLYMTRIQRERFASEEEYQAQKGVFILDKEKLALGKDDLKVLHPLPRVDEIDVEVDDDPRCVFFKQAVYGMYARMALILLTLEDAKYTYSRGKVIIDEDGCVNPRCITHTEPYMPKEFKENGDYLVCEYCDARKPKKKTENK